MCVAFINLRECFYRQNKGRGVGGVVDLDQLLTYITVHIDKSYITVYVDKPYVTVQVTSHI